MPLKGRKRFTVHVYAEKANSIKSLGQIIKMEGIHFLFVNSFYILHIERLK